MTWETREGTGSLFKNDKREKDTHPNAKGECRIGGVLYEIGAWTKETKNGDKWQSLSFKPKQQPAPPPSTEPNAKVDRGTPADMDSDVPF